MEPFQGFFKRRVSFHEITACGWKTRMRYYVVPSSLETGSRCSATGPAHFGATFSGSGATARAGRWGWRPSGVQPINGWSSVCYIIYNRTFSQDT